MILLGCWSKINFYILTIVVLIIGTELTRIWVVVVIILSIATYFWKLHPIIKRLDKMGKITPEGYSKTLGVMIMGFLIMFSLSLIIYLI